METGGRYVIIFGQPLMPMWPVDNLATLVQVGCNLYCARIWLMQYTHSYLSIFTVQLRTAMHTSGTMLTSS